MNIEEIGLRIASKRKELHLTQQQLANQLNVSDKAVSRWERGIGCPDVSLLLPLSEALHMTIDELISGVKEQSEQERNMTLQHMIVYAKEKAIENRERIFKAGYIILTILEVIAIGIVALVDYVLTGMFTWSLIAIVAIAYSWIIVTVLYFAKQNRILKGVITASIAIFPLLYVISLSEFVVQPFLSKAIPIAIMACICSIAIAFIWLKTNIYVWNKGVLTFLLTIPTNVTSNYFSFQSYFIVLLNVLLTLSFAIGCYAIGKAKRKGENSYE